ncbi:alpha-2-macroglobulin-like protein 1 [Clarias gariepinus]|uniref:alpha-2-macroglobulin-like protein 1 n=1 Tax=Clarias gariepinus TaxID=13013 RepID=UPI00234D8EB3|nr:alpha-2-macroglobulin-like protein 1 [Clarias gariepinus]
MLITPPTQLVIVKTDKPIYKPGQTVMFRIVSLDTNFLTYNQTFPTVELQDPNSNRIGQWLNVSMWSGLVDLSYPINSEATKGFYTITVWDSENKAITQSFQVKDYVLPTFEVNVSLPPVITILDTFATLKVCAKYTYGKPVNGTVKARVCHNSIRYWWFIPANTTMPDVCRDLIMKTDRTGCAQHVLNLNDYALTDSRYESSFNVRSEVEEYGTGVTLTGSGSSMITTNIVTLSFEDSPVTFKLGLVYEGKIKVTGPNSIPMVKKAVFLTISYGNRKSLYWKLVTDKNGMAKFSLQTRRWGLQQVSIQAQYETTDTPTVTAGGENQLTPYYPNAYLYIQPFFSESLSFIKLKPSLTPFSCNKNAVIEAQYLIRSDTHTKLKSTVTFYYMVMCKGHLVQRGQLVQPITPGNRQHKGVLQVTLENMLHLSPVAQVVLYTVLPSGEAIADSMNFPIQLYLANKVSLNILNASTLPGDQVTLILKAAPGSLCSVRAIDQSLLLLQPENELSIESLYNMLPVQTLSDYPYNTYDEDSNQCLGSPLILPNRATKLMGYFPVNYGKVDVYSTFKYVGIKILTNTIIAKPTECITPFRGVALESVVSKVTSSASVQPVVTVRKYFPETWIWDLVVVSPTGAMGAHKTIPDSITTWQVDAFCTSTVGFGIAQKINFTAFQPFFVSLTMPSSVVRGEVFTLMATVFNYLQSCMMVKVTLADSAQFSVRSQPSYSSCLCADESQTVSWSITPLDLGEISFNVTAEAVQSSALCGSSAVVVPEQGAVDTIIKTLLVQAEGTKEYESFNEILCPDGGVVKKTVSLKLPRVFVNGSAMASVSVVGDLMGRALQNLASLLAMPYGCGEQNMMLFAPNIFILQYLESTNQLTPAIRSTAENYLVSGYQRELTYKHTDGSYSAFGMSDASGNTWLTAFVMKSFGNAKRYIFVDQLVVDQAKTWLGQQQQKNGGFASVGQLIHKDMEGGVEDEVSLSAYISAAMMELNYTVTDPVVSKSLVFLRNACHKVTSIYTKALLFYTFTLAGDQKMRKTLMTDLDSSAIVSGQGRLWSRTSNGSVTDSLEVEMTSYVLLALMSGPELPGFNLSYSASIVRWLSQQQNAFGGFASTQDTVVALQALAKYSVATYSPQGAVTVTVTSPSGLKNTFNVTQSNRLLYQETRLQKASGDYSISAEGKGCVYVQFTLQYNTPPPPPLAFSSFSVSASASGNCSDPNPSLDLNVTVMYIGPRLETNMVIISVKLLSGFSVDETSVKLLNRNKNSTDGSVKRVDQADGEVNIYLNQLANGSLMEYSLVLMQDFAVKNLKPGIVKVYDYYETGDVAVTDYTSPCT